MIVLFYCYIGAFFILVGYYVLVFRKLSLFKQSKSLNEAESPGVSVVICARDEEQNLRKYLPEVLNQDYPDFEVIVVDDHSTDGTLKLLTEFAGRYENIRIVDNNGQQGKKYALKSGVEVARYDYLLFTDADCLPNSGQWIRGMLGVHHHKTEIILGYGPFFERKGLLSKFIRFDNFYIALQYLSFALVGFPYMGVGRNILYKKNVVKGSKSLERFDFLLSGDDDLLVNEVATNRNTTIMIDPRTHVFSEPKTGLLEFVHQKRRHTSAGLYYKPQHQIMLGTLHLSQVVFNLAFIPLLLLGFQPFFVLSLFTIKILLQQAVFSNIMRKLEVKNLWIMTPVLDFMMSLFLVTLGSLSILKVNKWK